MTFAAKYIFVPAACHLARGGTMEIIGTEIPDFEVQKIEENITEWKICLNISEFLIGDLEKEAECAELMQQNHTSEMTTVPVQQHVTSSIQPSLPSIQDSVVSGNIQYNINQSSAIQTGNDNASAGERAQRILTIISIVVTSLGIIAKIIQSAVG